MRDPIAVMRSLYEWAGDDLTESTEQAMLDWLDAASAGSLRCCARTRWTGSGVDAAPNSNHSSTSTSSLFDIELEGDDR